MRGPLLIFVAVTLSACATVHQEDLDAWIGQPVAALDTHPIYITIPHVTTTAPDGLTIRNYVNGLNVTSCTGGGAVFGQTVDFATYNQFASCVQRVGACNGIFYIRDGRVERVAAVGSGGVRCYTDERSRPGFAGSTNFR